MSKENFSTDIQKFTKVKGLSMAQLAREVNIGEKHLYNIAFGRHAPGITLAIRIARVLGLSVEEVFILEDNNGDKRKL